MSYKDEPFWKQLVNGLLSTREYKNLTGKSVTIDGRTDNSKWSGRMLRDIRREKTRKALDHHYALGGAQIDESFCIDLNQ